MRRGRDGQAEEQGHEISRSLLLPCRWIGERTWQGTGPVTPPIATGVPKQNAGKTRGTPWCQAGAAGVKLFLFTCNF